MEKKVTFLVVAIAFVCTAIIDLQAQEKGSLRTVSGVVTDNSGELLIGASITLKGTNTGVVSDNDGKYSINVPENAILRFSYIGYISQEIAVEYQHIMNVVLEDKNSKGLQPARPIHLTEKQNKRTEVDNSFAFKMFREVSMQEGENAFFSPLSLNLALGMLYNGASGNTRNEIVEAFGISDFSEPEINEYYQKISQALLEIDPTTDIAIANSIWYHNNFSVKDRFVEIGKEYFDAEVQALNFDSSKAANTINNWCAEKTENRIKNLIGSTIPNDMVMYLVNALYFKSQWQMDVKFDKEKTKLDNFTKANDQEKKVNMMEQTSFMHYYADENLQCVEMDYGNRAFSMVAVLPSKNLNINQLIDYLDNEILQNAVNNLRRQEVWLKLPRFKIECDFSLGKLLRNIGMGQMFKSCFGNISDDNLCVSDVIQKTFVEVNEEGTEAAAATTIIMIGAAGRQYKVEPVRFFADRPFLFLIREKSTGVILFIGRMDEPVE